MGTTGARDPITSALQIVLGKRVHLDIAQVVRWKTTPMSEVESYVRYAASFSGEKYRWMGPKRYDYAGTMVFLRHSVLNCGCNRICSNGCSYCDCARCGYIIVIRSHIGVNFSLHM
ncbi:putative ceramide kinase [Lupinus albus]|uniref:Putative ceramide kinase n=1 Tax=Lupinus albus TaxID=3870 RepID=A0A6A4P0M8_LUPAL|nr:putative ceramide kinase [Lupinus albus]